MCAFVTSKYVPLPAAERLPKAKELWVEESILVMI